MVDKKFDLRHVAVDSFYKWGPAKIFECFCNILVAWISLQLIKPMRLNLTQEMWGHTQEGMK